MVIFAFGQNKTALFLTIYGDETQLIQDRKNLNGSNIYVGLQHEYIGAKDSASALNGR